MNMIGVTASDPEWDSVEHKVRVHRRIRELFYSSVPTLLLGDSLVDYVRSHGHVNPGSSFIILRKPMRVFKAVGAPCPLGKAIVNLEIPRGAYVFVSDTLADPSANRYGCRKMRACTAHVHSVVTLYGDEIDFGWSVHDPKVIYKPGILMRPSLGRRTLTTLKSLSDAGFFKPEPCGVGIHFFVNLYDAWRYHV